jgi:hemoglobin/transferrin/lactoferrin receptor protein
MIKSIFIGLLFVFSSIQLSAQTLTILDAETNKPLHLVSIFSERPWIAASTNTRGQVNIESFKKATYIQIRLIGYQSIKTTYAEIQKLEFRVKLEPSNLGLDEVIVSATRWEQSAAEVASLIKTITPKEIELQNPQTAADLLNVSGAVFIQKSQQGGGSPMIRGFATNRLIYSVDGVRMNTAIFRSGNIQNVINLDPFATEHTEILFGPSSVIYGSDAIGGVMSFKTLTPQFALDNDLLVTGKAVSRYSSANKEQTAHADISIGGKNWASVTSVSHWDYDDLRQGRNGPDDYLKTVFVVRENDNDVVKNQENGLLQIPSAYSQTNFMQKLRYRFLTGWELNYGFHFSETSPYGRYDRHNRFRNNLPRYAEWNYGPQKWLMHNVSLIHTGKTMLYDQISIRLAYQEFEESRIDRSLNSANRTTNTEKVDAYSANLDFTRQFGDNGRLFYGSEFIFNDVSSNGLITNINSGAKQNGPSRYPQSTWNSFAFYANHEYEWTPRVIFQSGLRWNVFGINADFSNNLPFYPFPFQRANLSNQAITGSLGGVWKANETFSLRAGLGTAFRTPNVDDLGKVFDSAPGIVVIPNPNLKAEYAWNADIGLTKVFGSIGKLEFSAYYTILTNALVRRDFQLNGQDSLLYDGEMSRIQAIQNAAEPRVYGVQLGVLINIMRNVTFSTDLNFQEGEEELDNGQLSPSRHAAPFFGIARMSYTTGKVTIQINTQFQGERKHEELAPEEQDKTEIYAKDAAGNTYAPAWYTLNIKANYQINNHFALNIGLENITDQRYRPYSSGISGAGRNVILSLTARF